MVNDIGCCCCCCCCVGVLVVVLIVGVLLSLSVYLDLRLLNEVGDAGRVVGPGAVVVVGLLQSTLFVDHLLVLQVEKLGLVLRVPFKHLPVGVIVVVMANKKRRGYVMS